MDRSDPNNTQNLFEFIKNLPPHMGWGSITAEKRRLLGLLPDVENKPTKEVNEPVSTIQPKQRRIPPTPEGTIKIFGHVLDAIHRNKRDGCGRVWLLARYLDREKGEGRISMVRLRHEICSPAGVVRCLSKKRLQQIVRVGEGIFWHRSKDGRYLHYHSEARVAAALGVLQIKGFAVELPIVKLVQKIRLVRAVFYNAFHTTRGDGYNNPITRRVMQSRGMRERRTQRKYEAAEGIGVRSEFAVIEQYSKHAWQRAQYEDASEEDRAKVGGPAFIYVDYKGVLGKNRERFKRPMHQRHWHNIYIVRQVGNAYAGTLDSPKRGRGWTNQKIRHLCQSMQKITGSADIDDSDREWAGKFYYESDKQMERALRRDGIGQRPLYHPHLGYDLNWDIEQPKVKKQTVDNFNSFYWQEASF
ncbi:MAG: hypothetical protein AAF902_09745 [Chloroflexota bacterium]